MKAQKCHILKTFYVIIFVVKSISFQLLLRFTCSESRLYFVSVLQNTSVSLSVSLNENMSISVQFQFQLTNITLIAALWQQNTSKGVTKPLRFQPVGAGLPFPLLHFFLPFLVLSSMPRSLLKQSYYKTNYYYYYGFSGQKQMHRKNTEITTTIHKEHRSC